MRTIKIKIKWKMILLILICFFLLVSCITKDDGKQSASSGPIEIEASRLFELTSTSFFFDAKKVMAEYDYTQDRRDWADIMKTEFDIELMVHNYYNESKVGLALSYPWNDEAYNTFRKNIAQSYIGGLYKLDDPRMIYQMMESGLILTLDEYLADNKNWNSLPSEIRDAYKINGETWAVSSNAYNWCKVRTIRSDWLKKISMQTPQTVSEFYEVMLKFVNEDPDEDEMKNTAGFIRMNGLEGIEDIFAAFDVRLSPDGKIGPVWNPNLNIWEDSMQKRELEECIIYLKMCSKSGVLKDGGWLPGMYGLFNGNSGSENNYYVDPSVYEEAIKSQKPGTNPKIEILPGLTNNQLENVHGYYTDYAEPYVLLKNSTEPNSTINTFIDVFLADRKGHLYGTFGPEGSAYTVDEDLVTYSTVESQGAKFNYLGPRITGASPFFNHRIISDDMMDRPEEERKYYTQSFSPFQKMAYDISYYEVPWEYVILPYSIDYDMVLTNHSAAMTTMLIEVIKGRINLDDFIKEYSESTAMAGIPEFIDTQNLKLVGY